MTFGRKNLRLGTELSFAGVRLTPPKAFSDGEPEDAEMDGDFGAGGANTFLKGFLETTEGFAIEDDPCSESLAVTSMSTIKEIFPLFAY